MLFNYVTSSFDSALAKAVTKKEKSPNTLPTMSKKDLAKLKKVYKEKQELEKAEISRRINSIENKLKRVPNSDRVDLALTLLQEIKSKIWLLSLILL